MTTSRNSLLKSGERLEKLDLSGWIELRNMLKAGDDIVVDWPENFLPRLFDRPVRATVRAISSVNTLGLDLLTPGAKDDYGNEWKTGPRGGFMDVMWHAYRVVRED